MNEFAKNLRKKLSGILPLLNERHRRLLAGAEAIAIGYGGVAILAEITGMSPKTIRRGVEDIQKGEKGFQGIRMSGGGRKKIVELEFGQLCRSRKLI